MQIRDLNGRFMPGGDLGGRIGVRLKSSEAAALRQRAEEEGRTISDLVRWALAAAMVTGEPVEHGMGAAKWS